MSATGVSSRESPAGMAIFTSARVLGRRLTVPKYTAVPIPPLTRWADIEFISTLTGSGPALTSVTVRYAVKSSVPTAVYDSLIVPETIRTSTSPDRWVRGVTGRGCWREYRLNAGAASVPEPRIVQPADQVTIPVNAHSRSRAPREGPITTR